MGIDDFITEREKTPAGEPNPYDIGEYYVDNTIGESRIQDDNKVHGRVAEYIVAAFLTSRGYLVSFPNKDTSFDLIINTQDSMYMVEVKYSNSSRDRTGYSVYIGKRRQDEGAKVDHFDYLAAYTERGYLYMIPSDVVEGKKNIMLSPENKYCRFIVGKLDAKLEDS